MYEFIDAHLGSGPKILSPLPKVGTGPAPTPPLPSVTAKEFIKRESRRVGGKVKHTRRQFDEIDTINRSCLGKQN